MSLILILGLLSCRKVEKESSDGMNDSITRIEAEKAAREQAIQDSIENAEKAKTDSLKAEDERKQQVLDQMLDILANSKNRAKIKYSNSFLPNEYLKSISYFTTDYDKDGIPELWIMGANGYVAECSPVEVFKLNLEGKVVKIDDFCIDGVFSLKNGVVYSLSSWGSSEDAPWVYDKYTIMGDKLLSTTIDKGVDFPEDPNYKPTPRIQSVKTYPISNTSLLRESFKFNNVNSENAN